MGACCLSPQQCHGVGGRGVHYGYTTNIGVPRRCGSIAAESDQRLGVRDAVENVGETYSAGVPLGVDCDAAIGAQLAVEVAYFGVESGSGHPCGEVCEVVELDVVALRERVAAEIESRLA